MPSVRPKLASEPAGPPCLLQPCGPRARRARWRRCAALLAPIACCAVCGGARLAAEEPPPSAMAPHDALTPPKVVHAVRAEYPPEAAASDREADVVVIATVSTTGDVTNVEVSEHGGDPFDDAAIEAARQWKFTPASRNGKPIESQVRIPFHFRHGPAPPAGTPAGTLADDRGAAGPDHATDRRSAIRDAIAEGGCTAAGDALARAGRAGAAPGAPLPAPGTPLPAPGHAGAGAGDACAGNAAANATRVPPAPINGAVPPPRPTVPPCAATSGSRAADADADPEAAAAQPSYESSVAAHIKAPPSRGASDYHVDVGALSLGPAPERRRRS